MASRSVVLNSGGAAKSTLANSLSIITMFSSVVSSFAKAPRRSKVISRCDCLATSRGRGSTTLFPARAHTLGKPDAETLGPSSGLVFPTLAIGQNIATQSAANQGNKANAHS